MKASKNTITDLTVPQDGDTILPPRRIRLRHHTGNQAATGSQLGARIRGKHHPGLGSNFFSSLIVLRCHFACRKINLLAIDGWCRQHTKRAPHFLMHSCCTDFFLLVVRVHSHTLTPCTCMAQVTKQFVCVSPKNTHTSSRNAVHLAALDDTTHGHSFITFS